MCLIMIRPADKVISFEDLKTAINNNPDGYGITFPSGDGMTLQTLRSLQKPDPDTLFRLMQEELQDTTIMLHLRYNTVGKTSLRNVHPFPVLEAAAHGEDMRMAHNGTIAKWKTSPLRKSDESDTRVFVREYARPLFSRFSQGMLPSEILEDKFALNLLADQIPNGSVLTFLTGSGQHAIINEKGNGGGWNEDGVYYSNKYSFSKHHREPTTYPVVVGGKGTNTSTPQAYNPRIVAGDRVYVAQTGNGNRKYGKVIEVDGFDLIVVMDETGKERIFDAFELRKVSPTDFFIGDKVKDKGKGTEGRVGKVVTLGVHTTRVEWDDNPGTLQWYATCLLEFVPTIISQQPVIEETLEDKAQFLLAGLTAEESLSLNKEELEYLKIHHSDDFIDSLLDVIQTLVYDKLFSTKEEAA